MHIKSDACVDGTDAYSIFSLSQIYRFCVHIKSDACVGGTDAYSIFSLSQMSSTAVVRLSLIHISEPTRQS